MNNSSILDLTPLTNWEAVAKALPMSFINLSVILGNLLVIVAVLAERNLRTPPNILIMSLAITDLFTGLFSMPFGVAEIVMGFHEKNRWYFGIVFCKFYMTSGYTTCIASMLHLTAISIDRYRSVNEGIAYMTHRTVRKSVIICLCLWLVALWMASAPIFGWNTWYAEDKYSPIIGGMDCTLPSNLGYIIYVALGAFVMPCTVMIIVNVKIFSKIKLKMKEKSKVSALSRGISVEERSASTELTDMSRYSEAENKKEYSKQISDMLQRKMKFSLTKERKAAKTLGIIIGAFLICWTPFAVVYNITGFCSQMNLDCVPHHDIVRTVTWLLYCNSAMNPIIYTVYSQEFRTAFKKILKM